jgi:hypothetical protein
MISILLLFTAAEDLPGRWLSAVAVHLSSSSNAARRTLAHSIRCSKPRRLPALAAACLARPPPGPPRQLITCRLPGEKASEINTDLDHLQALARHLFGFSSSSSLLLSSPAEADHQPLPSKQITTVSRQIRLRHGEHQVAPRPAPQRPSTARHEPDQQQRQIRESTNICSSERHKFT